MERIKINDMTTGSPIKQILLFMIPMCLSNIFQQFYNIADSVIAGQFIGVNALAAIGAASSLMFMVTGWISGLSSGFSILVAQWFGAGKYDRMRHYVAVSACLNVGITIVMTMGLLAANEPILHLMNTPAELMPEVRGYMTVIYGGLLVTAAYNFLSSVLRALGDSRTPLYFLIISALINVVLDIVFIVKFGLGVVGCGYATVIAQGISVILCFVYIMKKYSILHLKRADFYFSGESLKKLLSLGIPMGLQFSITAVGTIIVQGAVNVYGPLYMAGFAAGAKVQSLAITIFIAMGATLATFVGQNWGAGRFDRVKLGVRYTQIMTLVWSVFMMLLMYLAGEYMACLFVKPSETGVVAAAVQYFRAVAWCYPFLGSIFVYRNALQGMGYGLVPMLGGVFELAARTLVVVLIAGKATFTGVCLSDPAAWLAALIPLVPYYLYVAKKVGKKMEHHQITT